MSPLPAVGSPSVSAPGKEAGQTGRSHGLRSFATTRSLRKPHRATPGTRSPREQKRECPVAGSTTTPLGHHGHTTAFFFVRATAGMPDRAMRGPFRMTTRHRPPLRSVTARSHRREPGQEAQVRQSGEGLAVFRVLQRNGVAIAMQWRPPPVRQPSRTEREPRLERPSATLQPLPAERPVESAERSAFADLQRCPLERNRR